MDIFKKIAARDAKPAPTTYRKVKRYQVAYEFQGTWKYSARIYTFAEMRERIARLRDRNVACYSSPLTITITVET